MHNNALILADLVYQRYPNILAVKAPNLPPPQLSSFYPGNIMALRWWYYARWCHSPLWLNKNNCHGGLPGTSNRVHRLSSTKVLSAIPLSCHQIKQAGFNVVLRLSTLQDDVQLSQAGAYVFLWQLWAAGNPSKVYNLSDNSVFKRIYRGYD